MGLAVARDIAVRGHSVCLVEREDAFAAGASSGNSGLGCTGYDAPPGSLERRLLRRSIQLHPNLMRSMGLSYDHVVKCGSLVVAWTPAQLAKLPGVLAENVDAGDTEAEMLTREELHDLEPALAPSALGAVLCPREAVVEPWLVPLAFAESARLHGADLRLGTEAVRCERATHGGAYWRVVTRASAAAQSGRSERGALLVRNADADADADANTEGGGERIITARCVINCAGLFGDVVETFRDERANDFTVTPRKGQFVVFAPKGKAKDDGNDDDDDGMPSFIIEPVATEFTKGVIIWKTVYGNVIVGPTAVPQQSRGNRSTDAATIARLRAYGAERIPALKDADVVGTYSGLRPATEHRDYQITARPDDAWITVGGIRSTGLTCAPAIGEYVGELFAALLAGDPEGGVNACSHAAAASEAATVGVTEAASNPVALPRPPRVGNGTVPPLGVLAADYAKRGDGTVILWGRPHRVTHCISSFGMESCPG